MDYKTDNTFEQWALVELFGHTRVAGKCTEHKFGNQSMMRIDVPSIGELPAFTKFVNLSAIYALNPMDEESCIQLAKQIKSAPIDAWNMQEIFSERLEELVKKGQITKNLPQGDSVTHNGDELELDY